MATAYENGVTGGSDALKGRLPGMAREGPQALADLPEMEREPISYLAAAARRS